VQVGSASDTFVQEAGVDEDDLIKAAGDAVYTLYDNRLKLTRLAADGNLGELSSLDLPPEPEDQGTSFTGLYLADATPRAAVVGASWHLGQWQGGCGGEVCPALASIAIVPMVPRVLVQPVALNPGASAALTAESRIVIDGRLVGSRRIGQQLLVVSTHTPARWWPRPTATCSRATARPRWRSPPSRCST
jgi:hypothetical protein